MADNDEEDDYLNMSFGEDSTKTKETSLQRTARLKREAAERSRPLSKAERAEKEKSEREQALATELDASNKGAKLMAKMGFKGGPLGKPEAEGRIRPIEVNMKDDRGGIGMDSEKKRKIREAAEATQEGQKRQKVNLEDYRERNRAEREEKRLEGQWWAAMKVLEGFETEEPAEAAEPVEMNGQDRKLEDVNGCEANTQSDKAKAKPLRSINILYRPLIKSRLEREQERRARHDLTQSLSRNREYTDEDADDKLAYGTEVDDDLDVDDEPDKELEEYGALPTFERLGKVVEHLRDKYHYCFWCKYRYPDAEMEGCPGLTEDEHG